MNILILNWRDPMHPLSGGAEKMLLEHAKYWLSKGEEVTWFASSFGGAKKNDIYQGIKILRKGSYYTFFIWVAVYFFLRRLKRTNIVIDCFHFIPTFAALYMKDSKKVALIHEVAGKIWFDNLPYIIALIGFKLEPHIINAYRHIPFITVSNSTKEELVGLGIKSKNISVIYNGFTALKIYRKFEKEKDPTIIFLGRISKDKGIEDALLAVELLARDIKKLKLWIVGKVESKKYERDVAKLVEQFKVKKNCIFWGFVSEEKKAELLSRAWILVHPSTREGWGMNVIEANSLSTPAVGYNVEGLRDSIIDGKTGVLVDADPISLADGIEKLIENKILYKKMQEEAVEWSKKYNWEDAGKESYKLLKKL